VPNTKKLLSITNLKKYFPIAKSSIFQKERLFVRANESITLDIHEGETVGIVGESGCGKSTLGRVILQLYEQTAGSTMYYGRTRAEIAPSYVRHTLTHAEQYVKHYRDAKAKAEALSQECERLGEEATFFQIQEKNLACANADSALQRVASILGGFTVVPEIRQGAALLLKEHRVHVAIAQLKRDVAELEAKLDVCLAQAEGSEGKSAQRIAARIASLQARLEAKKVRLTALRERKAQTAEELAALRAQFCDNAEFVRFEGYLDDGIDLSRLTYNEMRFLRKDLQIIFQDPYSSLDPRMTIGQIIEEGLVTHGFFRRGSKKMQEYVLQTMRDCGLQDFMVHRYPHQFSGGQRQRICIARALAVKPKFVVCDECVSALDVSIQSQIINLLQELQEKERFTYLFISHDLSVVRYISNRIAVMYLGNVVELADTEVIFRDPRHPYTVALLSAVPTTDPNDLEKERILIEGNIPSPIRPPSGCKFHTRCFMACDKCKRVPPPLVDVGDGHYVACHFPERKMDERGAYLFAPPKTEKKSSRLEELAPVPGKSKGQEEA